MVKFNNWCINAGAAAFLTKNQLLLLFLSFAMLHVIEQNNIQEMQAANENIIKIMKEAWGRGGGGRGVDLALLNI